jgi:predicted nucleic acid-binding protein
MARYVVDAPTLLHIASSGVEIHPDHRLVAPSSVRSDALSMLFGQVRRGELKEGEALRLHERITEVKIRLLGDRVSRRTAWRIASEQGWDTIGDAEYLAVTQLQADALIAMDDSLARRAAGIVPLAPPDALASASGESNPSPAANN